MGVGISSLPTWFIKENEMATRKQREKIREAKLAFMNKIREERIAQEKAEAEKAEKKEAPKKSAPKKTTKKTTKK